ncbi:apolipoprotein A-I-2 [Clupea harengus]|uniref:Apolipoprotein A-I-2 n=1 Tax=Clupea harengus TaxID=7950 RepID=A0A6P3VZV0_CLUHA|nr:apolipoprotein A-I-2 [Clupea harengus]
MKFVALALTILLVAGAQARMVQADAPAPLEHVRSAVMVYLTQVKETAQKALTHLDDTEYKDYKMKISQSLDDMLTQMQTASATLSPYTDAFATQVMEATAGLRASITADVEDLRKTLEPKREELRAVLEKHMQEYREKLEPIMTEYTAKHKEEMEALRAKMAPVVEELRAKVQANVEETKSKLVPIIEAVRSKLTERLEEMKGMATPYVEEYREQLMAAVAGLKEQMGKSDGVAEELKTKLMAVYETLNKAVTKA